MSVVVLKHEAEKAGQAYGPIRLVDEYPPTPGSVLGRPYRPKCLCPRGGQPEDPDAPTSTCTECGAETVRWFTEREAESFAKRIGADRVVVE